VRCGAPVPVPIHLRIQDMGKKTRLVVWIFSLTFAAGFVLLLWLTMRVEDLVVLTWPFLGAFFGGSLLPLYIYIPILKGKVLKDSYGVGEQAKQAFEWEAAQDRAVAIGGIVLTDNWVWHGDTLALMPLSEIVEVRQWTSFSQRVWRRRTYCAGLFFGNGKKLRLNYGGKFPVLANQKKEWFNGSYKRDQFVAEMQRRCPWAQFYEEGYKPWASTWP